MEDLNIKGLAAGMLTKSVHNAAWNSLVQKISYKAECVGSLLKLVDPRRTSQTCPECGAIRRKTLAERCTAAWIAALFSTVTSLQSKSSYSELNSGREPAKPAKCRVAGLRSRLRKLTERSQQLMLLSS
jgi:transposase